MKNALDTAAIGQSEVAATEAGRIDAVEREGVMAEELENERRQTHFSVLDAFRRLAHTAEASEVALTEAFRRLAEAALLDVYTDDVMAEARDALVGTEWRLLDNFEFVRSGPDVGESFATAKAEYDSACTRLRALLGNHPEGDDCVASANREIYRMRDAALVLKCNVEADVASLVADARTSWTFADGELAEVHPVHRWVELFERAAQELGRELVLAVEQGQGPFLRIRNELLPPLLRIAYAFEHVDEDEYEYEDEARNKLIRLGRRLMEELFLMQPDGRYYVLFDGLDVFLTLVDEAGNDQ